MTRRFAAVVTSAAIVAAGVSVVPSAQAFKVRPILRHALAYAFPGLTRAQHSALLAAARRMRRGRQLRLARALSAVPSDQIHLGVAMLEQALSGLSRAQQRAVLDSLLGAATLADSGAVHALAAQGSTSLEQFINSFAIQAYNAFPGDVGLLVQTCLGLANGFSLSVRPSPAACTGGLTQDNHQLLDQPFAQNLSEVEVLVTHALDQAPAGLRAQLAARDIAYIRQNIAPGDFFLGLLALRTPGSDSESVTGAVNRAVSDCVANYGFVPCSDDEAQLVMLGIAADGNGQLPLLQSLSQEFADCLLSVCSEGEQNDIERYLQTEEHVYQAFQQMLKGLQAQTQAVAESWAKALGP